MSNEALCIQWYSVGFTLSPKPFLYEFVIFDSLSCFYPFYKFIFIFLIEYFDISIRIDMVKPLSIIMRRRENND